MSNENTKNEDGITTSADLGMPGSSVPESNTPEGVSTGDTGSEGDTGSAKTSKKAESKKSSAPKASAKKSEKSEAKEVASKKETVTLTSADHQILRCQIDGVLYEGKSIEVPVKREAGIRSVLQGAGFKLAE